MTFNKILTVSICYANYHMFNMSIVACNRLRKSSTALSLAFYVEGRLNQPKKNSSRVYIFKLGNCFLALVTACNKTPALPPNLIIQWIEL